MDLYKIYMMMDLEIMTSWKKLEVILLIFGKVSKIFMIVIVVGMRKG